MHMPSGTQWLIILLIVVLLFGAKKIPELAKGLGKGIKTFKDEMNSDDDTVVKNTQKIEEKSNDTLQSEKQNKDELKA
ncbi:twin-arginine translocase TatA/TatE family subunit [Campylobacter sp. TTU-622]|uniref:Sec-independent protein translocase subunit TatA/TatB n=1 Tax=unclassified Campylobacter TaxID=2593542 RepID=UPI0019054E47|nr:MULTISPECIES: twin-arginine translocase TatA/TatE family subunit [unclassified Campylobacter]MBK1971477.1 twin-arginine translocase TatA/TatE family subunit [Campylobacter sp. TTU_617]MBK1972641.1 twin-arginine translocase TatA/TatE family subunit [Campylobacter sp. TTU-622]MBK1991258.1 twin-arginine translocase TatA/TatE family subunit [Campylobacter sp. 2018MI34]